VGCLIALLNAWLICSRLRASSPQALAGVRVSPTAANAPDDFDGRFIVSVCLKFAAAGPVGDVRGARAQRVGLQTFLIVIKNGAA